MATPLRPFARSLARRRGLIRSGRLPTATLAGEALSIGLHGVPLRAAEPVRAASSRETLPSRWFSSLSPGPAETDDPARTYESYRQALRELQEFHRDRERAKNERMFEAWQRAEEAAAAAAAAEPPPGQPQQRRPRQPGVAVVRTLAEETRGAQQRLQARERDLRDRAQALLERAARQGHAPARVRLGNQALEEAHAAWGERNVEMTRMALGRAMDLYRESQCAEGWFNLGSLLWSGYPDQKDAAHAVESDTVILPADFIASMAAFEEAIQLGDADAMYFVGVTELGTVEDGTEADTVDETTWSTLRHGLALVQDAAGRGHGGALHYLALLHLNGHTVLNIRPCESSEFVTRLDAAAAADYAEALFLRGHCYYSGEHGYHRDIRRALGDFLKAADHGHADAAVSAGAILHRGSPPCVARDQERAFHLYQHAGELGSIEGWRNVVACYATGKGVPQNAAIAKYIAETMLKDDEMET